MKNRNLLLFLLGAASVLAKGAPGALAEVAAVAEETSLEGMRLRSIGPAVMGGRIDDLAVMESRPWIFYVGTASGGLWKTTNNGTTWRAIFDDQETSSIGDVTLAPSDPETVWVGTGEPNNRQSSSFGNGVYKSIDGGETWQHMGLRDTHHIGRIVIHSLDPRKVYVAALGHLWGPNEERGVFMTTDGGQSWEKALFIDENTGVVDLAMDPVNPLIIYAAAYQRRRTPWGFYGGGPGSGLFRTDDGGKTWQKLSEGLPDGDLGRIGIDIYRTDPRIVYALVQSQEGGLFRSEDRGTTWERVNQLNPRPMYYSKVRIDPNDRRRIYVLGAPFYVSSDGGETFQRNTDMTPVYDVGVHGDHHALWINPANSRHLILGGDGGLHFSWDASSSWDKVNNLPIAQFYAIGVDMQNPYFIYAGAQDTHSWGGPSATHHHIGIVDSDWFQINFGDGMYQQVDPTDPDVIYTESQGGNIVRFNGKTGDRKVIRPRPREGEPRYRFHWTAPIRISSHDSNTLYLGGNRLFISKDRGETWTSTPDLTRAEDRNELPIMGILPEEGTLSRHDGTSFWGTITTVAESPVSPGLLWVGTDDGVVQVSRDGGQTWTNLAGKLMGRYEERSTVSRIVASHADAGRAYVSFDRHQLDDFAPYVFTTDDFGNSWRAIHEDLPQTGWVNVVVEHPRNPDLLFVGTETGLFVSFDRGEAWGRLTGNFPTVPVDDLVIHPRDYDLVVGTHGRSIYILDDLTPFEQYTKEVRDSEAHLFDVRVSYQFLPWKHESYGAQRRFIGENPPRGALISYYLGSELDKGVDLSILDGNGNVLRELKGAGRAGFNRIVWDLRIAPPEGVPQSRGPFVVPGRYRVRLSVNEKQLEKAMEVEMAPGVVVSGEELRARYDFLAALNRLRAAVQQTINRSREIEEEIGEFLKRTGSIVPEELSSAAERVQDEAKGIREQLAGAEGESSFSNPSLQTRASRLFRELDGDLVRQGTLSGPTSTQRQTLRSLERKIDDPISLLNHLVEIKIPDLNRRIQEAELPWIRAGQL